MSRQAPSLEPILTSLGMPVPDSRLAGDARALVLETEPVFLAARKPGCRVAEMVRTGKIDAIATAPFEG